MEADKVPATVGTVRGHGTRRKVLRMQPQDSADPPTLTKTGLLFLRGHAASLRVNRGHLIARAAGGSRAPVARFARGDRQRIRRVVVLGRGGYATWEALAWLHGVGASFLAMDPMGRTLAFSGHEGPDQPALRRAQAAGLDNGSAVEIARCLLRLKLDGQASVLRDFFADETSALEQIADSRQRVEDADRVEAMVAAEAKAAHAYWGTWEGAPMRFARADAKIVPEHWLSVGERHSPLSSGPRLAVTPAQAILNYLYALAEFECRVALLAIGLDPGMGWFHRDAAYRDSAALDLIEAVRPHVDGYVAQMLASRTFSRHEFRELPNGQVRVSDPFAQLLAAEGLKICERAAAAPGEEVARLVAGSATSRITVRTRLTQADRKRGRKPRASVPSRIPNACRLCGLVLENADRQYCGECLPEIDDERRSKLRVAGRRGLREMRSRSDDPAQSPQARAKRQARLSEHARATREWEALHGRLRVSSAP